MLEKEKQPLEEKPDQREVEKIFSIKKIVIFLPKEATHSSLDMFEKQRFLITFENAFD